MPTQFPTFPRVIDKAAAKHFIELMLGWTSLGSTGDESVERPTSPEIQAHLIAALGANIANVPAYAFGRDYPPGPYHHASLSLASYLRSIADQLDPTQLTHIPVQPETNSVPTTPSAAPSAE